MASLQQLSSEKLHGLGRDLGLTLSPPFRCHVLNKLLSVVSSVSVTEPRGSVLSLSDLSLNLNLLEALIVSYGFHYHKHADDIQIRGSR